MGASAHEIVMESRQEIVDKLIAQMEKGYASTRAAWNSMKTGRPYNPESEAVYNGINRFRLMFAALEHGYEDPRRMQDIKLKPEQRAYFWRSGFIIKKFHALTRMESRSLVRTDSLR